MASARLGRGFVRPGFVRPAFVGRAFASLVLTATLSVGVTARAIPEYPGDLEAALKLDYAPDCSICHEDGVTELGTVKTPFGTSMRANGLTDDPSTFPGAIAAMMKNKVDSVGRGYSDVEALKKGQDPNAPPVARTSDGGVAVVTDTAPTEPATPSYGCNARVSPSGTGTTNLGLFGAVALAGAAFVRRRPRSPPRA